MPWHPNKYKYKYKYIIEVLLQPLAYSLHGADAVRVPGLAADISQQIAKYDSSEFDDDKEVAGGDAEGFDCKYIFLQQIKLPPLSSCSIFVSRRIC